MVHATGNMCSGDAFHGGFFYFTIEIKRTVFTYTSLHGKGTCNKF